MQEGSHVLGTTEAVYVRPEPDKEKLIIEGPLNEILILYVLAYISVRQQLTIIITAGCFL